MSEFPTNFQQLYSFENHIIIVESAAAIAAIAVEQTVAPVLSMMMHFFRCFSCGASWSLCYYVSMLYLFACFKVILVIVVQN